MGIRFDAISLLLMSKWFWTHDKSIRGLMSGWLCRVEVLANKVFIIPTQMSFLERPCSNEKNCICCPCLFFIGFGCKFILVLSCNSQFCWTASPNSAPAWLTHCGLCWDWVWMLLNLSCFLGWFKIFTLSKRLRFSNSGFTLSKICWDWVWMLLNLTCSTEILLLGWNWCDMWMLHLNIVLMDMISFETGGCQYYNL